MKIYLVRHADAIELKEGRDLSDDYRYITPGGRKATIKSAEHIKDELAGLDIIFTSPLVRAVQTAEIIATVVKFKNEVEIAKELAFSWTISRILQIIDRNKNYDSIAFVGHEPTMSALLNALTGKALTAGFKKSGICLVNYDTVKGKGTFEWFLNPKKLDFIK